MSRVLVIDNYDSFTYNLVQELGELGADLEVVRNDACDVDGLDAVGADGVVVSPGPCTPAEAGISKKAIEHFAGTVPVLGVCLGHQAIAEVYGGDVVRAPRVVHGKTDLVHHDGAGVLADLPTPFEATRYHSLVVSRESIPDCLEVTAETADGLVMGLRHRELAVEGVQFHPESIMTTSGMDLLANFLAACAA
ncbi:MAG: aminodeoxychorismate/anthranilate synthase component II [Acidimicrobiia bacterium]|nr:aminodeoxychorismate/anthranilate synthase component II [Acidimicrobiia bacterium]